MTKDYIVIERSDIGRTVTDSEWQALRSWVTYMTTQAMEAVAYLDMQGVDEWTICKHNTLTAPFQSDYDCFSCELEANTTKEEE